MTRRPTSASRKGSASTTRRSCAATATEVRELIKRSQETFARANPSYEQMEGVVAGVPELADYDVIIDAGADASDPENAVPFSLTTPDGRTFKQPGNFNFLVETSLFGTEPRFAARGVEPDLDGDGRVEFGEALPDAGFYVAAAREFERTARELDRAAGEWRPTLQDALTALVVMTPTMSEYFEAWKNSRFVAGSEATEKAFVVASRLQDISDILGGLVLVYDNVRPSIARADAAQAAPDGQRAAVAARVRDAPARPGARRTALRRPGRRHAGQRGAEPGRGDRRADLPGRRPSGHRARELARAPCRDAATPAVRGIAGC